MIRFYHYGCRPKPLCPSNLTNLAQPLLDHILSSNSQGVIKGSGVSQFFLSAAGIYFAARAGESVSHVQESETLNPRPETDVRLRSYGVCVAEMFGV